MKQNALSILVVDDDEIILDLMTSIVREMGAVEVASLKDAHEAMQALHTRTYDIVLTDLLMPGHSGLELLEKAIELNPRCLVTLVTGYGDMEDALRAIRAGAYGYIHKPFRKEELSLLLRNMATKIEADRKLQEMASELSQQEQFIAHLAEDLQRTKKENDVLRARIIQSGIEKAGPVPAAPVQEPVSHSPVDEAAFSDLVTLYSEKRASEQNQKDVRRNLLNRMYGEPE